MDRDVDANPCCPSAILLSVSVDIRFAWPEIVRYQEFIHNPGSGRKIARDTSRDAGIVRKRLLPLKKWR
jgi:hypothetical protein